MLRIHPEATPGTYTIPPDNPFYGSTRDKQGIWLYGLRNPRRASWDRQTGRMFIADVGQATREEIDVRLPSNPGGGGNYGWRFKEGFVQSPCSQPTPPPGLTDPIFDYPHTTGMCIIGGYVYRGTRVRDLRGVYVFADAYGPDAEILPPESGASITTGIPYRVSKTSLRSYFPPVSAIPVEQPRCLWEDNSANSIFAITATVIFTRFFDSIRLRSVFRQSPVKNAWRLLPSPPETTDRNEIKHV